MANQTLTVKAAENMTVAWDNANGPQTFIIVVIASNHEVTNFTSGISGIGSVFLLHFLNPESTSMNLPPTSDPMFGPNSDYFAYVSVQHVDENPNFDDLFLFNANNSTQNTAGSNFAAGALPFATSAQ